jgi:hypothetical protein
LVLARLILAVLLAAPLPALARCKGGIYVFPTPGAVIPTNSTFIIEGAGEYADKVAKLAGRNDLVLKSKTEQVDITVGRSRGVDYWASSRMIDGKDQPSRVAVVLTLPKGHVLTPNTQYTLLIDRVLSGYSILNDNGTDTLTWTTGGVTHSAKEAKDTAKTPAEKDHELGIDRVPPKYQVKPAVEEGFYKKDGDNLTRYLKMRVTLDEEAPAYFIISMKRARGNNLEQKYPVPINGGEAILGHDGCSGSFDFEDGRAYKLEVSTYDAAGNKVSEPLKTIEVQAPRPPL